MPRREFATRPPVWKDPRAVASSTGLGANFLDTVLLRESDREAHARPSTSGGAGRLNPLATPPDRSGTPTLRSTSAPALVLL